MTDIWLWLAVMPFLIGALAGLLMLKFKKSYFVTLGVVLLSIIAWIVVSNINTHGSEGPGLRCVQISFLALGMVAVEVCKFIYHKLKR